MSRYLHAPGQHTSLRPLGTPPLLLHTLQQWQLPAITREGPSRYHLPYTATYYSYYSVLAWLAACFAWSFAESAASKALGIKQNTRIVQCQQASCFASPYHKTICVMMCRREQEGASNDDSWAFRRCTDCLHRPLNTGASQH